MLDCIDLSGIWSFELDEDKKGLPESFYDTIYLPGTTSHAKKGKKNEARELGYLTDEYKFEGYAWFQKSLEITDCLTDKICHLYLERTRVTTLWIDGIKIGTQNSLNTPHIYDITKALSPGTHIITILVDNTEYLTKGGHLTSPDTQTNWNGITGKIELQIYNKAYLSDIQLYPDIMDKSVTVKAKVKGLENGFLAIGAESFNSNKKHCTKDELFSFHTNEIKIRYALGEDALLWSEHEPNLYKLKLKLMENNLLLDSSEVTFGMRAFKTSGRKFIINGAKTFLRGKHDGLIFPKTGFAPTTLEEWLTVMKISKTYGINHYRFHTCCPPEAAFEAADQLGIYMEPELPFWGTLTDESYENHNQTEQDYLVKEGVAILSTFGNHPSFAMMSLGNELWGSAERMSEILRFYKAIDNRHLYTQGSNNFQFTPVILEEEDFFCGVRFSRDRLIRGSYAECDAPLGHVQSSEPSTRKSYDEDIYPSIVGTDENVSNNTEDTIEIQYGTGVKKVKTVSTEQQLLPMIPVVSHEIGQYETYPDYREISKYTGSLKARNLETFQERLIAKGLGDLAEKYFTCSGKLAAACYKEELEAAFRSKKLAGFQILDLQDFSGQGTALVGILDAFMDSKGLISPEEWRSFCSDAVLLARFDKYNYTSDENFNAKIELSYYKPFILQKHTLVWELKIGNTVYEKGKVLISTDFTQNYYDICHISLQLPEVKAMEKLTLCINIDETDIFKNYDLWVYPRDILLPGDEINVFEKLSSEAIKLLEKGEKVLLIPKLEDLKNSIEGCYCTDFWCYPMFRFISEERNKKLPVGTMGLLINNSHPIFEYFPCEEYSTYPWWSIVTNSRSIVLDNTPADFLPIVQTIDNFERNHKLGLIFECNVLQGKLLVCSCDFDKIIDKPEGKQLLFSIWNYFKSDRFQPKAAIELEDLTSILYN
ncbi:MAG: glycoside hydrolase family 2 TIM barrel-domain containing protein [Mobilitalea sp.]